MLLLRCFYIKASTHQCLLTALYIRPQLFSCEKNAEGGGHGHTVWTDSTAYGHRNSPYDLAYGKSWGEEAEEVALAALKPCLCALWLVLYLCYCLGTKFGWICRSKYLHSPGQYGMPRRPSSVGHLLRPGLVSFLVLCTHVPPGVMKA